MRRVIDFWQIMRRDGTPLAAPFPTERFLDAVAAAKAGGQRLEVHAADGTPLQVEVLQYGDRPRFPVLYKPRRQNQGHLNDRGTIRNLPFAEGQCLTEPTYFRFFNRNIVGFISYVESPRPRRLIDWINKAFDAELDLVPIYDRNLDAILGRMSAQSLKLTIPSAQAIGITQNAVGDWAPALSMAGRLIEDGSVSITLSVGRGGTRVEQRARRQGLVQRALSILRGEVHADFISATVNGSGDGRDSMPLDLLEHRVTHKAYIDGADFIPNEPEIRDDSPLILAQYNLDKEFLDNAVAPLALNAPDLGLLHDFREGDLCDG